MGLEQTEQLCEWLNQPPVDLGESPTIEQSQPAISWCLKARPPAPQALRDW